MRQRSPRATHRRQNPSKESSGELPRVIATWWRNGPNYEKNIDYFVTRRLIRLLRIVVGTCAFALGGISLIRLLGEHDHSFRASLAGAFGAVIGLAWAVRWQIGRIPSLATAVVSMFTSSCAVFLVAAAESTSAGGAFTITSLTITATFSAVMFPPTLFTAHSVFVAACVAYFIPGLLSECGVALAVGKILALGISTVWVPTAVQIWLAFLAHNASVSYTDALCGTLNRRGFLHTANTRIADHRNGLISEFSVLAIDVDHYKNVNDTHGHAVGDAVLVDVASIVSRHAGLRDGIVGRLGGDEFAILYSRLSPRESFLVADELRAAIARAAPVHDVYVTASIGVAAIAISANAEPSETVDRLLAQADFAMYASKSRRNCVTLFEAIVA